MFRTQIAGGDTVVVNVVKFPVAGTGEAHENDFLCAPDTDDFHDVIAGQVGCSAASVATRQNVRPFAESRYEGGEYATNEEYGEDYKHSSYSSHFSSSASAVCRRTFCRKRFKVFKHSKTALSIWLREGKK
jgi:hypothetical protein